MHDSHAWYFSSDPDEAGDTRCLKCDCRYGSHVWAYIPCGSPDPRGEDYGK